MTARDHIDLALAHLGDRTRGAARTYALLAIAEAILEITPPGTLRATHSHTQPLQVPQHQRTPKWATGGMVECLGCLSKIKSEDVYPFCYSCAKRSAKTDRLRTGR